MGLRISTNTTALNAQRQMAITRMHLDKSLEKLATLACSYAASSAQARASSVLVFASSPRTLGPEGDATARAAQPRSPRATPARAARPSTTSGLPMTAQLGSFGGPTSTM